MALQLSLNQVSSFAPGSSSIDSIGILILVVNDFTKSDAALDFPVEVEQSCTDWNQNENGKY